MTRKYYKTRKEALAAVKPLAERNSAIKVWRMPNGSRHPRQYMIGTYEEYLNTY